MSARVRAQATVRSLGLDDFIRSHAWRHVGAGRHVTVGVDEARIMKMPGKVATIVIGNPLIADASLQSGGILVITGKGYGVHQSAGARPHRQGGDGQDVQVLGPAAGDLVVVYKGIEREILQLRAGMRAPPHAWRLAGLFQRSAGADRRPHHSGASRHGATGALIAGRLCRRKPVPAPTWLARA